MQRPNTPAGARSRITAVLGPTNTGKTHMAMERMLGHASGMIGFPLRLLARENYDRAVRVKGRDAVALITGEERIEPKDARYFLCTVEAMPLARRVAFLAIDEVQMGADPDRGHLFTERLLRARGEVETMLMGADTIRPLLRRLVPAAEAIARPRFSTLSYAGTAKLSRLPPRSAIVAFSVADVYAIAELIRRERGGAAIVLGALSPRTRNAQVALYQGGEVDYLVATDAIGMGLNMAIDHVAFAATRKYDGRVVRALQPAELAQIAGRAGRYARDGSFGTTADIGPLAAEEIAAIEGHQFAPLAALQWRNPELAFTSIAALKASLARPPRTAGLVRARAADDELALHALERDPEIAQRASGVAAVRLLWEVCRIPDFGRVMSDGHARLLAQIYRFLAGGDGGRSGRLPADWVAAQVARLARTEGDIEALMQRIAGIRIWTYVAQRADWLDDAQHWQQRTRRIEDQLSDALHERLTQRFVDRRTASVYGRLKDLAGLGISVDDDSAVSIGGHAIGRLDGFCFVADDAVGRHGAGRAVTAAVLKALAPAIAARLSAIEAACDRSIVVGVDGRVSWRGAPIARLVEGAAILAPRIEPLASDLLKPAERLRLRRRLDAWLRASLAAALPPLLAADDGAASAAVRGLLFQLGERLGTVARGLVAAHIDALSAADRRHLHGLGLRIGRHYVYFPALQGRRARLWRAVLATLGAGGSVPPLSPGPFAPGPVRVAAPPDCPEALIEMLGYGRLGPAVVRVDRIEDLAGRAERLCRAGSPVAPDTLAGVCGCSTAELPAVLAALGYRVSESADGITLQRTVRARRRSKAPGRKRSPAAADGSSAFAALQAWTPAP